jgi:site-specific recombinase XerD
MRREHKKALDLVERDLSRLGQSLVHRKDVAVVARAFLAHAGKPLARLEPADVRAFLAARRKTGITATTQANELSRLRSFFTALARLGLADSDPTAHMRIAHAPKPHLLVSEEAVARLFAAALAHKKTRHAAGIMRRECAPLKGRKPEALLDAASKRDRAALELLYGLGLRSAEVRAARVTDLDFSDGTLLVRRAKRGDPERLPLPPASIPHLRSWLEARPLLARGEDEGRLLVGNDGTPYGRASGINKLVARVAKRAGVRVHPHALRRGVATHLVRAGASVVAVQHLLGHKSLDTTAIYVEATRDDLRKAIDTLDRE